MTAKEQIGALMKCGCESAIREIRANHGQALSPDRLRQHLEHAVDDGFVYRAMTIAELVGTPLVSSQLQRLIKRCLELEWVVDAIYASKQGMIPADTREILIRAMIAHQIVANIREATEVLNDLD